MVVRIGIAAVLAAAIATSILVALSGGKSVAATMRSAGCSYHDVAPYPPKDAATTNNYHNDFPTLSTAPHWSTFPPSAGGHYRLWAVWGFYRSAVNPRMVVHNEEHGGVVIWWGPDVPRTTVDKLKAFYDKDPDAMFGTPIAGLDGKIALTAWTADPSWKGEPGLAYFKGFYGMGHIAVCSQFDQAAFTRFRDAYRGKSPQGFPLSGDRPGCGPEKACPAN